MKRICLLIIAAVCLIGYMGSAQTAPSGTITYQQFYDQLAPYGTWIHYPGYGEVWHPKVGGDFRPYATNGYWENTDQGLYWESGYDWGWGPFHYGRWMYDDNYGWLWIPGYEWSPAWVTWGDVDDYYAWAPLAPELLAGTSARPHDYYWNMVERNNIYDRNLSRHLADENRIRQHASGIRVLPGRSLNAGGENRFHNAPDANEMARHINQPVPVRTIRQVAQPVSAENRRAAGTVAANEIPVYRPHVNPAEEARPAEARHADSQHINPVRENSAWPAHNFNTHINNVERLPMHDFSGGAGRNMPAMRDAGRAGDHGHR